MHANVDVFNPWQCFSLSFILPLRLIVMATFESKFTELVH